MPSDRFSIPFFYPSKTDGFFYEASDDPSSDKFFDDGGNATYVSNDELVMNVSGATSVFVTTDPAFQDSIGGCNMSFADSVARGYTWKQATDIRDVEWKCLISVVNGGDHGLSFSGPTGHHKSNSSPCCQGFAYMFTVEYNVNPATFRFRKEIWHVNYNDDPKTGIWTSPLCNFKLNNHGWVGLGYCRYNKKDGVSAGKDSVIIELWFNPDPDNDIENWTMLKRTEDKGGWASAGGDCDGDPDQIGTWAGPKFRIKSNDTSADIHIKHLTLREIDPTKTFDDNTGGGTPEEPPQQVTTLQGSFKVQWDVNQLRTSPCAGTGVGGGGGGETGNTVFYDVAAVIDKELSDSSTFQNRTGVVEQLSTSTGVMNGKTLVQLDVPLKKVGSPGASPTVGAKIINASGATIYTSPTTFDPSTFTTSYVYKIFDFSGNTHVFVTGDAVGVFYTGTSSSNYVKCGYTDSDTVANCVYANYESGSLDVKSSREFACRMWQ